MGTYDDFDREVFVLINKTEDDKDRELIIKLWKRCKRDTREIAELRRNK